MAYGKQKKPEEGEALRQFKADLKAGTLRRLYVFYGEEAFLREHYLAMVKRKVLEGPAESFNFHRLESGAFSCEAFEDAVESLPMMAERTLVQVDDCDLFHLPEAQRERMAQMLAELPEYCVVVFVYDIVAWKPDGRMKSLSSAIAKNAQVVEFAKQSQRELGAWVRRHFKAAGKEIPDELCQYLIFRTGGDMTTLNMEIEKVAAYQAGGRIQKSSIDAVVEPVLDAAVFDITDAVAAKNFDEALRLLRVLLQMQEEPIPILAAIGGQLRRLYYARTLSERGKGADSLARVCGLRDYPARKTMAAAAKCPTAWCRRAAMLAAETDWKMKTSYDSPARLLEMLLLQLSEV